MTGSKELFNELREISSVAMKDSVAKEIRSIKESLGNSLKTAAQFGQREYILRIKHADAVDELKAYLREGGFTVRSAAFDVANGGYKLEIRW